MYNKSHFLNFKKVIFSRKVDFTNHIICFDHFSTKKVLKYCGFTNSVVPVCPKISTIRGSPVLEVLSYNEQLLLAHFYGQNETFPKKTLVIFYTSRTIDWCIHNSC